MENAFPPLPPSTSSVQRTSYTLAALIQDVRINHRRTHILMSQQFLHGADIIAIFQKVRGKAVPERMTTSTLYDSGGRYGSLNRGLNRTL